MGLSASSPFNPIKTTAKGTIKKGITNSQQNTPYRNEGEQNQCWTKIENGCRQRLSETNTPTNWFVDHSSATIFGWDCNRPARIQSFVNYCGNGNTTDTIEQRWGPNPNNREPEPDTSTGTFRTT